MKRTFSGRIALLLAIICSTLAEARIFTDSEGRTIDAELVAIFRDEVTFRRTGESREFTVPISNFAEKDRLFILKEKEAGRLTTTGYTGIKTATVAAVRQSADHQKAAAKIDSLLNQYRTSAGFEAAPRTDDSTFLRRAYLTVIGRIPTYAEAVHFLHDDNPNKRVTLVDQLLNSNGYVSHNFNIWADILRAKTTGREGSIYGGVYFIPWLKQQIRDNVPYDQFVRSLISADGYPWDNPAAYYYLRDFGMPLDNMSLTSQVFLGTQMQCAQCHDHPTDVWTQKDFYELSAFTYGQKTGVDLYRENDAIKEFNRLIRAKQALTGDTGYNAPLIAFSRDFFRPMRFGVVHSPRKLRLPHDYQYEDALPHQVVKPQVLFGELPHSELEDQEHATIDLYAEWMTSKDNKRFSKVIANRIWKQIMGRGLIEPVDQLTAESKALSPELMDYLEELMKSLDYDLKQFQRVLLLTAQFQRQSIIDDPDLPDDYHLQGPVFKRMTAEQIWDSLATLMTPEIDRIEAPAYKSGFQQINYEEGKTPLIAQLVDNLSGKDMIRYIDTIIPSYQNFNKARTEIAQLRSQGLDRSSEKMREAQKSFVQARNAWTGILNGKDPALQEMAGSAMSMQMSMGSMMSSQTETKSDRYQPTEKWLRGIRRASELSSPAGRGHLLEIFGQSDRDLVENSDHSGSITQALFLMNSPQSNSIFASRSTPVLEARRAPTAEKKLETLYIGFLARKPTEAEKAALLPSLRKQPEKARERIIWAMLNTRQFVFIQ
ncbi:MAG: DUF1549 domain-containing protein [Coraliomargaritaceae bacterium]